MVPLGALVKVTETHGPNRALRYNGYPAAEINGATRRWIQLRPGRVR
jgi:multidrug efflux pump subunit AcrB